MEKLLTIISIGEKTYGRWLFQHLLSGVMLILGLTIVVSILVSAILISGLFAMYFALLLYGLQPQMAMLVTGITSILAAAALVILAIACVRHLRQIPRELLKKSPIASRTMDTLDDFLDGLMANKT